MASERKTMRRTIRIPEDLYNWFRSYSEGKCLNINYTIIEAMVEYRNRRTGQLFTQEVTDSTHEVPKVTQEVPLNTIVIQTPDTGTSQVLKSTQEVTSVTQEVTAPSSENIESKKPELPKGEVPLAGLPSSGKPKEPQVDFSWATRRGNLKELVVRWVDVFRKWDIKQLEDTFRRCKGDDPTREAVIIVMKERFVKTLPETEKAMIRKFFKDEEVQSFMKEHGIKGIEEPAPEEKPEESQEVKPNA